MLTSKFIVLSSLANIARSAFRTRQVSKNPLRNQHGRGSKIIKGAGDLGKNDGKKSIVEQASAIGHAALGRYMKMLLWRKSKPKAIEEPVEKIDNLTEASRVVEKLAKEITQSIQTRLETTQRNIEKEVKKTKDTETARFHELCRLTECKLQILIELDAHCGMEKRRIVLMFNDQVRQAFEKLQADLAPAIEQTSLKLNQLQRDTHVCAKRATDLVRTCSKHKEPLVVEKCTELKKDLALSMLEKTQADVCLRMEEIEKRYRQILLAHRKAADDVMEAYSAKAILLAEDLHLTIQQIKRRCQ